MKTKRQDIPKTGGLTNTEHAVLFLFATFASAVFYFLTLIDGHQLIPSVVFSFISLEIMFWQSRRHIT